MYYREEKMLKIVCGGYQAKDCGTCKKYMDKEKFGGNGKLKQSCVKWKCLQMVNYLYYQKKSS